MNSPIINFVLPLLGIGIIVFCMFSYLFRYGEKFKDKTQKIKGFGVDMEVSVLTLFIIIGILMSLSGIYLHIRDFEKKLDQAKTAEEAAREALKQATKTEIKILMTLEGIDENNMPRLNDIQCKYYLYGEEEPVSLDVTKGYRVTQLKATLKDISCKALIASLVLEDRATQRKWIKETFMPFEPEYQLKKE